MSHSSNSSTKHGFFQRPSQDVLLQLQEQILAAKAVRRRGRVSKLLPTISVVKAGIDCGFSLEGIRRLVQRECNVVVNKSTICRFIKTHPQLRSTADKSAFAAIKPHQIEVKK